MHHSCSGIFSVSLIVASFSFSVMSSASAFAQEESARELFVRAMDARQSDDLVLAEELLTRSLELDPRSATVFNLAEVRGRLGRNCEAVSLYRALTGGRYGELGEEQSREVESRERAAGSRITSARITVRGAARARLRIDTRAPRTVRGNTPVSTCLDDGEHLLSASSEGFLTVERQVQVEAGADPSFSLELGDLLETSGGALESAWFWAGTGALVIGAAVLLTFLLIPTEDTLVDPVFGNKAALAF